jgi:hypothetical protein
MKSRPGSFLYFSMGAAALMAVACSSGGGSGNPGTAGSGGGSGDIVLPPADQLISNFEDAVAVVVQAGTPPRNGYWYSYNDGTTTCMQVPIAANKMVDPPIVAEQYVPTAPATFPSNGSGSTLALHAKWMGCSTWGAGVGADLGQPAAEDGGTYDGPKVPYDLTGYTGFVFWAMSSPTADTHLRVKVNMTDETKDVDGGLCKEDGTTHKVGKCSDAWGQLFTLPTNGNWQKVTVNFSDTTKFKQEGWGDTFPWNPAHAVSIQIQSQDTTEAYDFWIDDMYLTK